MLEYKKTCVISAPEDCPWASKMILNPAMTKDPNDNNTIHMLFRATGPYPEYQLPDKPLPYPIFLGYAVSKDSGENWDFDFSTPAMTPELKNSEEELIIKNASGKTLINYANGCIEDPRLFYFEKELYLVVACRAFPPGPYWDHDDPVQCMPNWALTGQHNFGTAVTENSTVTLLYKTNLDALKSKDYANAFDLIGPMHNPDTSDDRDVVLFPRKLKIDGEEKIVCIHRPKHPWNYEIGKDLTAPSIFMATADSLESLPDDNNHREVFAVPTFEWEQNRIGASWAPIEISDGEWLLPYHGKQNDEIGYTQSFMILKERDNGFPEIIHRPSERLLFADKEWELKGDFTIPCVFTCSGLVLDNGELIMGYGASDQRIGTASINFNKLISYVKQFDAFGNKKSDT